MGMVKQMGKVATIATPRSTGNRKATVALYSWSGQLHRAEVHEHGDRQRSRVYRWEHTTHLCNDEMTDAAIIAYVRKICDWYELPMCGITFLPKVIRRAWANVHNLTFPLGMRRRWVVEHEVAHYIAGNLSIHCDHGPNFVRVLLEIRAREYGHDLSKTVRQALDNRIRVAPEGTCRRGSMSTYFAPVDDRMVALHDS